jgi:hypothetical protein
LALFTKLEDPATQPEFWSGVADDVDWTLKGTHPLAGRYHNKAEFVSSTFARLAGELPGGVKLHITNLFIDGETGCPARWVGWHSTAGSPAPAGRAGDNGSPGAGSWRHGSAARSSTT